MKWTRARSWSSAWRTKRWAKVSARSRCRDNGLSASSKLGNHPCDQSYLPEVVQRNVDCSSIINRGDESVPSQDHIGSTEQKCACADEQRCTCFPGWVIQRGHRRVEHERDHRSVDDDRSDQPVLTIGAHCYDDPPDEATDIDEDN